MTNPEILIQLYRIMQTIREFEDQIAEQYWDFQINFGELHLCRGQEAIAAGVCLHLRTNDAVEGTHRSHGHIIAKGVELRPLAAEIFGKQAGLCKGKGGHMHLFDHSIKFGCSGIVGASMPLALGSALKAQLEGSDRISVAFFGDGAVNQGMFHESLNLASIWKLPVLFVCENNHWAISTPFTDMSPIDNIADRACAYAMKSYICDGNDVLNVYQITANAIAHIREGKGPVLLEAKTYRLASHMEGDTELYKSEKEQETWEKKDPISQFEKRLLDENILTFAKLKDIKQEVKAQIKDAVDFALESPYPDPELAFQQVFYEKEGS